MEIFVVEAVDPSLPNIGGTDAYCRNLLKFLSENGVGTTLLGISNKKSLAIDEKFGFRPVARKTTITGYEYILRLMVKVPLMKIPPATIIHVQRPEYLLPFILYHWKNPKMVTLHGKQLEGIRIKRRKIVRWIYEIVEPFILRHSDLVISVDESTKEFYQREYPWLAKIRVIPTGINLSKFRLLDKNGVRQKYGFKPDDKVIAFVGRLEKEKNLDFLLGCFARLKETVPGAVLVLVGDGRDRDRLEGVVRSEELDKVVFMGAQDPDKVPEIMNCADVLALCSLIEGSPTVVKEALACGLPVVSTDVGDVTQIIKSPSSGKIVSQDKEEFTRALADVLLREDGEAARSERAREATVFGFAPIGARTVELYKELLMNRRYAGGS